MLDELARRRGPWIPAIHRALGEGVESGAFPGGACAVILRGECVHLSSTGEAQQRPSSLPTTADTLYDLASLTKVLATTAVTAALVGRGKLDLDELVIKALPAFARGGKQRVTVRDLLAHRSGLPAWRPYFTLAQADPGASSLYAGPRTASAARRGHALLSEAVLEEPLERPPGEAMVYSDVGFIALGLLLEAAGGKPLDALAEELFFRPLGLPSLQFRPLGVRPVRVDRIAATGLTRPREPTPEQLGLYAAGAETPGLGEVDDDNAYAMGGVAGHAGLFGNARDVALGGARILEELDGAGLVAPRSLWEQLATRDAETPGSTRALGFDTPSAEGSSSGTRLGRGPKGALGHLGFTGTSLWIDRDRQLSVALLTNRVHPSRAREGIRAFRPAFHDAVIDAVEHLGD